MSEAVQMLEKVRYLLEPLGLTLKGEDGVKDLSQGDKAHLLGFSLRWDGSELHLGLEPNTFKHLEQHLGLAHVTPNPTHTACTVVLGWIEAYAPAFEDGNVAETLTIAAENGFRELPSLQTVKTHWQDAWKRWQRCRDYIRRSHPYG
jgi:hypothetical protein